MNFQSGQHKRIGVSFILHFVLSSLLHKKTALHWVGCFGCMAIFVFRSSVITALLFMGLSRLIAGVGGLVDLVWAMTLCVTLHGGRKGIWNKGWHGGICRYPESITSPRIFVELQLLDPFLLLLFWFLPLCSAVPDLLSLLCL
jgi:hypothetical protein